MTPLLKLAAYQAGSYHKTRPRVAEVAQQYVSSAEKKFRELPVTEDTQAGIPPTICFSRKIGVGAVEIADGLSAKLGVRVADRLIIENIAADKTLKEKTIRLFDERYPGKIVELGAFLFGEKSFVMTDYIRALFGSVYTLAESEPTIFVGRGAHLILPRERVLAVRLICSKSYRVNRLANMLDISNTDAEKKLAELDEEQKRFFKKVFKRQDASPYEFDLVINMDFIRNPAWAVDIVHTAFTSMLKDR